jgi:hypothetical protein
MSCLPTPFSKNTSFKLNAPCALAVEIKDGTGWRAIEANAQGAFSLKEVFLEKGVGRQDIRFAVTIDEQTIYVEYPILVKDATAPTLSIATMTGDAKEHTATSTALMKSYRIVKGGQIVVPSVTIPDDMDEGVAVEISWKTPSGAQITTTAGTSLTLNEVGVYYLVYRAEDGAGNIGHCTYKIEARNFWLDVMAEPKEMVLGAQYTPEKPIVKDFMTGEGISDFAYSTSITFRGKDLPNSNGMFTLDKAGVYTVQYVVAYEGQEERCETTVTVQDTTKPVIAINGNYKRKVDVNTTISLLTATAKDDGRDLDVEVLVLFNGSRLALENNAFQASTVGVYTIVYKAEDEAGNITEEKIEIQVVAKDSSLSCNSSISYATVSCFALLGIMLVCLLKRKERKD